MGSKMEPKSKNIWWKINLIFVTISKALFLDLGSILVPKTSPKWKVSGLLFQPCCEYARSVILNNPPIVLLYFSTLEASIFNHKKFFFMCFFKAASETYFSRFGVIFSGNLRPGGTQNPWQIGWKLGWFFNDFLMDSRSPRGRAQDGSELWAGVGR